MHLILAAYRYNDLVRAVGFCDRHIAAKPNERRILVVNDPELVDRVVSQCRGWEIVAGSNALGEFSAWQEGLDRLGRPDSSVMFANDTLNTHRHFTAFRTLALMKTVDAARGATLVGFRDRIEGGPQFVAGVPLDGWVSTYCFFLTAEALHRLDFRVIYREEVARCVPGGTDEASFFAELSPEMAFHLRRWLFQGWWYAGGPLTAENRVRMTRKAEAIISEKVLSAKCQQASIQTADPFVQFGGLRQADRVWRKACALLGRRPH